MKKSKLTVLVPVFNEEQVIEKTITDLKHGCKDKPIEIVVIDDGSSDKTADIIKRISGIKVLTHPYNKGYGAALKTGILSANTEYVSFFDSDGQHNVEDLINLWNNHGNYDMIVGERGNDSHVDWIRKPGKWLLNKTANFLVGKKIPDLNSGLRVMNRDQILRVLHLMPDGFSLTTTSTVAFFNLGLNVGYYPIKVVKRVGKSTVRQLEHGPQTLLLILRLMVLFNPLKVFLTMSLITFVLGFTYELIYGVIIMYPNVRLLPAAMLLLISSLLFFFFGLVADQIAELRKHHLK